MRVDRCPHGSLPGSIALRVDTRRVQSSGSGSQSRLSLLSRGCRDRAVAQSRRAEGSCLDREGGGRDTVSGSLPGVWAMRVGDGRLSSSGPVPGPMHRSARVRLHGSRSGCGGGPGPWAAGPSRRGWPAGPRMADPLQSGRSAEAATQVGRNSSRPASDAWLAALFRGPDATLAGSAASPAPDLAEPVCRPTLFGAGNARAGVTGPAKPMKKNPKKGYAPRPREVTAAGGRLQAQRLAVAGVRRSSGHIAPPCGGCSPSRQSKTIPRQLFTL